MSYELVYTRQARKDAKKIKGSPLGSRARELLDHIADDPYVNPPPFERLVGDIEGAISRRINIQHRLVYQVFKELEIVKVLRIWTHYE